MAKAKIKEEASLDKKDAVVSEMGSVSEVELQKPSETKVKFLVWFSEALERFEDLKPHHMSAVKVYFSEIGLNDPDTPSAFDEGLFKFGFGRKK